MKIKQLLVLFAALSSPLALAAEPANHQADNVAINAACASDAQTAGCGGKQVGTGLLRCLHDYKQAHKDFALSAGCKTAVEKRRAAEPAIQADNAAINTACTADAQTAGCSGKQVGTGLLRCLHDYKQTHKEFVFSADCKAAIQKRQADQKHTEQKGK